MNPTAEKCLLVVCWAVLAMLLYNLFVGKSYAFEPPEGCEGAVYACHAWDTSVTAWVLKYRDENGALKCTKTIGPGGDVASTSCFAIKTGEGAEESGDVIIDWQAFGYLFCGLAVGWAILSGINMMNN